MSNILRKFNKVAVICELNPPHSGHARLVAEVRRAHPDSTIAAIMSGNFVQRGEPAIFPKHARAVAALELGFDLVIELPTEYVLSSAERFARAGVTLAASLGVEALAFGAECGDLDALCSVAGAMNTPKCDELTRAALTEGVSYAAARQRALQSLLGGGADVLRSPNNLLAIEYIRAARTLAPSMKHFCIKREPGVTATAERAAIRASGDATAMLPENLDVAVLSRLRTMTLADFARISGGEDGVAERTARYAADAATIAELADLVKSKRHAHSRIRRFILAAALGLERETAAEPQYLRVLAANERGRVALRELRVADEAATIITKPAAAKPLLQLEAAATDLYNLGNRAPVQRKGGAEWRISPCFLERK